MSLVVRKAGLRKKLSRELRWSEDKMKRKKISIAMGAGWPKATQGQGSESRGVRR